MTGDVLYPTQSFMQSNIGSAPGLPARRVESMCRSRQPGCQVLPSYSGTSRSSTLLVNSPLQQSYSESSICNSSTLSNQTDVGFASGRNFQKCHNMYDTVAGESEWSYPTDIDVSQNSVSSFGNYGTNRSVCSEGYGLKISSTSFHRQRQNLEISRHDPNVALVNPNNPSFQKNKKDEFRKLVLIFQSDEIPEGGIHGIRSFFGGIDNDVKVDPMRKEGKYTITCRDTETAREALKLGKQKGLTISRKFQPRAKPTRSLEYIALVDLPISKGKSLPDYVGLLKKGQKVTVNQAKGRRVRLIKPNEKVKTWGWVSMFSEKGKQQLALVGDNEIYEL